MLIVGERINSSRKEIYQALEARDESFLLNEARRQVEAGADYLDVNAGAFAEREEELVVWMIEVIQREIDRPLCIDSPNPRVILRAAEVHRGVPLINSISLEEERYGALIPLIKEKGCPVIALCLSEAGMPKTQEERVAAAGELIRRLTGDGVPLDRIHIDPLIETLATNSTAGRIGLEAIRRIRNLYPEVHIISGLSNLSHGLPARRLLNRSFLLMAVASGMDGAILDPCDRLIMAHLKAADLIMGNDDYSMGYIQAYRAGRLSDAS